MGELIDQNAESVLVQRESCRLRALVLQFENEMFEPLDHLAPHFGCGHGGAGQFVLRRLRERKKSETGLPVPLTDAIVMLSGDPVVL